MTDKSSQAFRTIGEMAKEIGVKTHILRYWEEQLPMLQPMKRPGGRRLYRPGDAAMLRQIHHLMHDQGYTVKGVRRLLEKPRGAGAEPVADIAPVAGAVPVADLKMIRARLSAALAAA